MRVTHSVISFILLEITKISLQKRHGKEWTHLTYFGRQILESKPICKLIYELQVQHLFEKLFKH